MECHRCGEKGHMQFACPQEGRPEVDLSLMLKAIVVSKGTEESLKRFANNWKEALTEADALRRKRDSLQQAVNRMTKELTVKDRVVQERGKEFQSTLATSKRCTRCSTVVELASTTST